MSIIALTDEQYPVFWDINICSIRSRWESLRDLLECLASQSPDTYLVRVNVFLDNPGEHTYPAKCQALLERSKGRYVSMLDDDDMVAPDFIPCIAERTKGYRHLTSIWPHYVGFGVRYTIDGVEQLPVVHSLRYNGWNRIDDGPRVLQRDITQFNPMLRSKAVLGTWDEPGWQADWRWANQIRATGQVTREEYIDRQMYYKQDRSGGDFRAGHAVSDRDVPELFPSWPWLRWIW